GARIIDNSFVVKHFLERTAEAFDRVQLFGVHTAAEVEPRFFVETNGVYYQGIPFPMAYGVSKVRWVDVLRVRTSIHVDFTPNVSATFENDNDAIAILDDFCWIRGAHRARATWGQTETLWVVLHCILFVVLVHRTSPGQHRRQIAFFVARHADCEVSNPGQVPHTIAAKIYSAVSQARRRSTRL